MNNTNAAEIKPSPPDIESRRGRVRMTRELITRGWPDCLAFFSKFAPIGIEWNWQGIATYTGFSEMFDPVPEGIETPLYMIIFTRHEDGRITFTAEKEKE